MVKKAIVADDMEMWRSEYGRVITSNFPGTQIDEAASRGDLVSKVLGGQYDLIVTDNDMPERNAGLDAIRDIRRAGNRTPIIMVTARTDAAMDAVRLGAEAAYDKADFDGPEILEEMAKYL